MAASASASVVVALKTLFSVLGCVMFTTLLWAIATDGLASCVDLRARWLAATYIDFYINVAVIVVWFVYKESSWMRAVVLIVLEIVFGRCMIGTLTDFYFNVVALSVWVAYKKSSWISAFLWILSLICFGSIGTCAYILRQLYLTPQQPVSFVLFNNNNRLVK